MVVIRVYSCWGISRMMIDDDCTCGEFITKVGKRLGIPCHLLMLTLDREGNNKSLIMNSKKRKNLFDTHSELLQRGSTVYVQNLEDDFVQLNQKVQQKKYSKEEDDTTSKHICPTRKSQTNLGGIQSLEFATESILDAFL